MNRSTILAIATAMSFAVSATANAADEKMEKCSPMDKSGKTLVKAHKNDCKSGKHSCAGQASADDADSWIYVPAGICDKIKAGEWKNVPSNICDKIEGCKK
jgi:uncharacterized membrane protein